MESFKTSLAEAVAPIMRKGMLEKLPPEHDANAETIAVRKLGTDGFEEKVPVAEVLVENVTSALQKSVQQKMPLEVADRVFAFLKPRLPVTLKLNLEATGVEQDKARPED